MLKVNKKINKAVHTLVLYMLEHGESGLEMTMTVEDGSSITVTMEITNIHDAEG